MLSTASTATSPSTLATARTRPNMPRSFSTVTSRRSVSPGTTMRLKRHVVDSGEEPELAAVLVEGQDRDAGGLGQGLDHQDAGHDRAPREVAGELRLVGADLLDPDRAPPRLELDDAIDEEERVAVRKDPHDVGRLERQR